MTIEIKPRYWALITLLLWGTLLLTAGLLRFDAYGINEAASRAILLGWSVADKIISTAFIFGFPDLRALLFIPLGLYWPGSILAIKVFGLLVIFTASLILYAWNRRTTNSESALIATGLLLIAPVTIGQADAVGVGPYLLLSFGLGMLLDRYYRERGHLLSGWFFLQLLLILFAVSLHPMGLAYPIALIWGWQREPIDERHQRNFYIGAGIAVTLGLLVRLGWGPQPWLGNPITALASMLLGQDGSSGEGVLWASGMLCALLLTGVLYNARRQLLQDFMSRTLFLAVLIGLLTADQPWVMIALAVLLFLGIPRLIAFNQSLGKQGMMGQRGVVLLIIFLAAIFFMQGDKAHQQTVARNLLNPQDQLLRTFALDIEGTQNDNFLAMSQWPGRTMLILHRPVLPLPPVYPDVQTLMRNIKGTTHIIFAPFDKHNKPLSALLSQLNNVTKTLLLEEGGAVIAIDTTGKQRRQQNKHD